MNLYGATKNEALFWRDLYEFIPNRFFDNMNLSQISNNAKHTYTLIWVKGKSGFKTINFIWFDYVPYQA